MRCRASCCIDRLEDLTKSTMREWALSPRGNDLEREDHGSCIAHGGRVRKDTLVHGRRSLVHGRITDAQRQKFATLVDDTVRPSNPACFSRIAASASPRTRAQPAHSSGSASISVTWSKLPLCANRESILVCLTNSFSSKGPAMSESSR
jgi:hypothetical protein